MPIKSKGTAQKPAHEISVCVIGAGVCGIVSVKACLEQGFKVDCYDKSPFYGGLWHYHPDSKDPNNGGEYIASVMRTTILNTSKELSAFSDFPPPAHLANFMRHNHYMDYIESYVENFHILPHLRLQHEVVRCEPEYDPELDEFRWSIDVRVVRENKDTIVTKKYDKLMVAVGHHNIPYVPAFPDQHKFRGQILHTVRVKDILTDERFIDKRVLVIGLGNSACDAANDLALVAKQCYVSCHRGNWFVSRLTRDGLYDFSEKNRFNSYRARLMPASWNDKRLIRKSQSITNHELLGLTPKHNPSELFPAINDLFPFRIFTGGVILKPSVLRFTETGVVFREGQEEEEEGDEEEAECQVDIVVLATGYVARVPFLDEFELGLKSAAHDAEYELYMNMFAPKLTLAGLDQTPPQAVKSLAFIGLVQPSGSITVISELQARWAALIFSGKRNLPETREMLDGIESVRAKRAHQIRSHSKDQIVGNWVRYADLVAEKIGAKPNMSALFFKDFPLWKSLMFGPSVSYQYRLAGPHSWAKARETCMTVWDRVYQGINEGKNHILFETRQKALNVATKKVAHKGENKARGKKTRTTLALGP